MIGVYRINNMVNGKNYIGSVEAGKNKNRTFHLRWKEHKTSLNKNNHYSKHLQRAWNYYGGESFQFIIEEVVPTNEVVGYIKNRETYYIKLYRAVEPTFGYNTSPEAYPMSGRFHTEETKNKIRGENCHNAVLDWKKVGEIRRMYKNEKMMMIELAKLFNVSKDTIRPVIFNKTWYDENYAIPPMNKKKVSIERIEMMRKLGIGRKLSTETKKKIGEGRKGEDNPFASMSYVKVKLARYKFVMCQWSQTKLANIFGVSNGCIQSVLGNKSWYSKEYQRILDSLKEKMLLEYDEIRKKFNFGENVFKLSKRYGHSRTKIKNILHRRTCI